MSLYGYSVYANNWLRIQKSKLRGYSEYPANLNYIYTRQMYGYSIYANTWLPIYRDPPEGALQRTHGWQHLSGRVGGIDNAAHGGLGSFDIWGGTIIGAWYAIVPSELQNRTLKSVIVAFHVDGGRAEHSININIYDYKGVHVASSPGMGAHMIGWNEVRLNVWAPIGQGFNIHIGIYNGDSGDSKQISRIHFKSFEWVD